MSSDERLKNVGGAFERGVDALRGIKPITYNWNASSGFDTETLYTGFSAQNIQEFIPEAVGMDKHGFLTLSDRPLLATVINATKEQQIILDQLIVASSTVLSIKEGDTFWSRLTTLVSNFVDGVLTIAGVKTNTVETNEVETNILCVGETCVDEATLKVILQNNNQTPVSNTDNDDTTGDEGDTASTTMSTPESPIPENTSDTSGTVDTPTVEDPSTNPEPTTAEVPIPEEPVVETVPEPEPTPSAPSE